MLIECLTQSNRLTQNVGTRGTAASGFGHAHTPKQTNFVFIRVRVAAAGHECLY